MATDGNGTSRGVRLTPQPEGYLVTILRHHWELVNSFDAAQALFTAVGELHFRYADGFFVYHCNLDYLSRPGHRAPQCANTSMVGAGTWAIMASFVLRRGIRVATFMVGYKN